MMENPPRFGRRRSVRVAVQDRDPISTQYVAGIDPEQPGPACGEIGRVILGVNERAGGHKPDSAAPEIVGSRIDGIEDHVGLAAVVDGGVREEKAPVGKIISHSANGR
jgi:hypothetical protein